MELATKELREEHAEILECVEELRLLAGRIPGISPKEREREVERAVHNLRDLLLPHAEAEEKYLYPIWEELIDSPCAAEGMTYEHAIIKNLLGSLPLVSGNNTELLQEKLYGLYALISNHFEKEEMIIFTILDKNPEWMANEAFEMLQEATA